MNEMSLNIMSEFLTYLAVTKPHMTVAAKYNSARGFSIVFHTQRQHRNNSKFTNHSKSIYLSDIYELIIPPMLLVRHWVGGGPRVVVSTADREVACSASDRQGSNFESCVWRTVSSQSSHHPQEVLLAQFSLYVHKGGLKPDSFHFI